MNLPTVERRSAAIRESSSTAVRVWVSAWVVEPAAVGDAGDVGGDLAGAVGGLLHRPRHLTRGRRLLLDRGGDRGLPVGDLRDDRRDLLDRRHRRRGVALDGQHPAGDVLGRLRRLLRQLLDLVGHDREALAGLTGPRRLDRGVQRQQVCVTTPLSSPL